MQKKEVKKVLEIYKQLLEKKNRPNSLYYDNYYQFKNLREAGIVQAASKSYCDRVSRVCDELLHIFGFEKDNGSFFELKLSNVGLIQTSADKSPRWNLVKVKLVVHLVLPKCEERDDSVHTTKCDSPRYIYECEQLIDYKKKHLKYEDKNIYKIGSLSIETVQPYSLTRIYFNGLMQVQEGTGAQKSSRLKPIILTISTHPTCDKFYYPERIDKNYQLEMVGKLLENGDMDMHKLEDMLAEIRFDQPLMFQGQLNDLSKQTETAHASGSTPFTMWGAKVKLLYARDNYSKRSLATRDCLYAWSECGQQIHLSRPDTVPSLVGGMVHNSCDYASPLCGAELYRKRKVINFNGEIEEEHRKPIEFKELESFGDLTREHVIRVRGFKTKLYTIEFLEENPKILSSQQVSIRKIRLNCFNGWALSTKLDLGAEMMAAQRRLWTLDLHDELFTPKLAQESLLGGKGNSLVELVQLIKSKALSESNLHIAECTGLSVPKGLVVTTEAYQLWLDHHSAEIDDLLHALDALRLELAAKSVHQDPMSSGFVSTSEAQKRLSGLCESTQSKLASCELPVALRDHLLVELEAIFGPLPVKLHERSPYRKQHMGEEWKLFAVRSSCVGEDSLETSAAGQMKTILDASSIASIFSAIIECWSSQFSFEALTYKSQNGLAFNLPMAVVVQELVDCYAAGVATTCDPLTGNKCQLVITGNRGMGENVVAGKQTDTMRILFEPQALDLTRPEASESEFEKALSGDDFSLLERCTIEKSPSAGSEVCLSDKQIISLGNILLRLRRLSGPLRNREIEWGITLDGQDGSEFRIHLLQSRPLTHLHRLSTREIDHELDSGLPCPLDMVSRANLGEVMPGAMCPLNLSWFWPITAASKRLRTRQKPFEPQHSRQIYVAEQFGYHARMIVMVVTSGEALKRFGAGKQKKETENGREVEEEEDTTARDVIYSMLGSTFDEPKNDEERAFRDRFFAERVSPVAPEEKSSFLAVLAADASIFALLALVKRAIKSTILTEDLVCIDKLAEELRDAKGVEQRLIFREKLMKQIKQLYERLLMKPECLVQAWRAHVLATLTNMAMNAIALKLLCAQPTYKERACTMVSSEVLNDFSVLVRGSVVSGSSAQKSTGKKRNQKATESGDISRLLEEMLDCFMQENQLEHVKELAPSELREFLNDGANQQKLKSCKLYARFMHKNGHRAHKEFDLATKSWSDDQSYITNLLVRRLKSYTPEFAANTHDKRAESERLHAEELARIESKLTVKGNKLALMSFAVPRARSTAIRREKTKSLLMRGLHKYRLAFRHLGGLMCLAGLLPSADLIFYLSLEELDEIMTRCCKEPCADLTFIRGHGRLDELIARCHKEACAEDLKQASNLNADTMPRLLYKARRRQQRTRAFDKVTFPRPTMSVTEMLQTIREQTDPDAQGSQTGRPVGTSAADTKSGLPDARVEGITSCAGCVTGRACVISSLDEAEQLEPNDILITYSIDISWSVHFYQLAGIVTEVGGIVSHGAVVAREYGLPTLCTAVGACSKFSTGQMVTLDASRSVCYLATSVSLSANGEQNEDDDK